MKIRKPFEYNYLKTPTVEAFDKWREYTYYLLYQTNYF